jgi:hypothetical protein
MKKRRLWIIPLVVLLHAACHDRSSGPVSTEGGITGVDARTPDYIVEEAGVVARYYDATNPYAVATLAAAVEEPSVARQLRRFEAHGYAYRPEHSFVSNGESQGRSVEICMGHRSRHDAVVIFCIRDDNGLTVVPTRLSNDATLAEKGFHEIQESVWFGPVMPWDEEFPDEAAPGMHRSLAAFGWSRWASCMAERVFAGLASCSVTCRLTITSYLQCLTICTGGHTAYALVYCSIRALMYE